MAGIPLLLVVAVVSTALVWKGGDMLEGASEKLAIHYGLPSVVQGAVIGAVGSSFPELSSTVISTLVHGEFELGVSVIVGSAIFNVLVISGIAGLVSGKGGIDSSRDLVYKETQFYMLSVSFLLITFALSAIYNPAGGEVLKGTVTRGLAVIPVLLYFVYLFIQFQDSMDLEDDRDSVSISPGKEWLYLIVGLVGILIGVEGLLRTAMGLGDILGTPSFLWGLTVVALATSLPDLVVSLKASKRGNPTASLANVFGSNTFDLLIAVPAGVLIAGSAVINFSRAVPLFFFLIVATVVVFFAMRTDLNISRNESILFLVLYAAFVTWMVLETFGVTSMLPI